jgi:hypothetical protein
LSAAVSAAGIIAGAAKGIADINSADTSEVTSQQMLDRNTKMRSTL